MASPSSASIHLEEVEPDWQNGLRSAKKRRRASTAGISRASPREVGVMREPQVEGSASFLGSSSGIHFIRHVYNAFARRSADLQQNRSRDKSSVPGEDDRLLRGDVQAPDLDPFWHPDELSNAVPATFSFEDLVDWTRRYFETWHPCFPCLHAPSVLNVMEKLASHGPESIGRLDMIIIRSIVSISLGDERQGKARTSERRPVHAIFVFHNVHHVMQEIQSLLIEPTTLPLLQAAFTTQLALVSLLRLNAASRVGGIITRSAFHLGLHRCPSRFSCFSLEETDLRRRVFWSIYSLERYLSQALGIPLGIRDDDIDVCYPDHERHAAPNARGSNDPRLRLLCYLAKFSRVRGLIVELRNKSILHSHASTRDVSRVNGEICKWWNEVYDDVYPVDDFADLGWAASRSLTPYHRLVLMILRHEAIIAMNRPLLAAEERNSDYEHALQLCIASSRSLLGALKRHVSSKLDSPLSWPSFTWATWMACLILMYASWDGELPITAALKYARMGVDVLENLSLRGSGWPETCIEAIKSMEVALSTDASHGPPQQNSAVEPASSGRAANSSQLSPENITQSLRGGLEQRWRRASGPSIPHPTVQACRGDSGDISGYFSRDTLESEPCGSSTQRTQSAHFDGSTNFMTPGAHGYDNSSDTRQGDQLANPQNPAGLIFGNLSNGSALFYPGSASQDQLPFLETFSPFLNDSWSVADGPWMIHGNLL